MYACVWVCCIATDVHRLAEHYLCCVITSAARTSQSPRVLPLRAGRSHFRSCFFGVCQKTEFFTLRRNKARAPRVPRSARCTSAHTRAYTPSCTTLCVSSCAQPKLSNQPTKLFLEPKTNPEKTPVKGMKAILASKVVQLSNIVMYV